MSRDERDERDEPDELDLGPWAEIWLMSEMSQILDEPFEDRCQNQDEDKSQNQAEDKHHSAGQLARGGGNMVRN